MTRSGLEVGKGQDDLGRRELADLSLTLASSSALSRAGVAAMPEKPAIAEGKGCWTVTRLTSRRLGVEKSVSWSWSPVASRFGTGERLSSVLRSGAVAIFFTS